MATPAIAYIPSEADAARFWREEYDSDPRGGAIPEGYPAKLISPLAWKPRDIERNTAERYLDLSVEDLTAIDRALAGFEYRYPNVRQNLSQISADTFVLPAPLVKSPRQISDQCYNGLGFKVVRGLTPAKYTPIQNVVVYAGIAAHIAPQRGFVDVHYSKVISHIVNAAGKRPHFELKAPPGFSNSALSFHTDNCEILAMYCLDTASKGGESLLSSSWNLYNELASTRPDILKTLTEEWILDTFKDYDVAPPRHSRRLDSASPDKISVRFSRYGVTGWHNKRNGALPVPSAAQIEATNAVQFIAAANCIRLPLRQGEMLFLNDMAIMHGREAFSEEGVFLKRHFLKMLLRDPAQNWPVPESAKEDWLKMYGPNRADGSRSEGWDPDFEPGGETKPLNNG